jgi:hypothetical protein
MKVGGKHSPNDGARAHTARAVRNKEHEAASATTNTHDFTPW